LPVVLAGQTDPRNQRISGVQSVSIQSWTTWTRDDGGTLKVLPLREDDDADEDDDEDHWLNQERLPTGC
jgi:hypothetical protein